MGRTYDVQIFVKAFLKTLKLLRDMKTKNIPFTLFMFDNGFIKLFY